MQATTNPHYRRIVGIEEGDAEAPLKLPRALQALRVAGFLVIGVLLLHFLSVGTMESRVNYVVAVLIGLMNPLWALYALVLMAPLYLQDQGKTHNLAGVDVFVLGALAGELRLLGRRGRWNLGLGASGADQSVPPPGMRPHWGFWPHYLCGILLILLASSVIGIQLLLLEDAPPYAESNPVLRVLGHTFYFSATSPYWTLKCLWNWSTGMAVAVIAAQRMTPLTVARWLKLGAIGLVVACFYGILEWLEWIDLRGMRMENPDPLQAGRLQGPAGHPGWMGQWIVFLWPGILLWRSAGRTKRNLLLVGAVVMVLLALVLTAARAPWLGALVTGAVGGWYVLRTFPAAKRQLPWVLGGIAVIAAVGVLIGGEVLTNRIVNLLRASDRANYYVSGLLFLREHPLGLGLGTHYVFYESLISPFYYWRQVDHVTAHSLWLHTLIENGPAIPALLLFGVAMLLLEVRRAWPRLNPESRTIMLSLWLGMLGLMTVSIAQYFFYLRVVEVCFWIAAGATVGITRRSWALTGEEVESRLGPRLMLLCGVVAIAMAFANAGRQYAGMLPRHFDEEKGWRFNLWTGTEWRTPVNNDIDRVEFTLYRKQLPMSGVITWPDGTEEPYHLKPEESRWYARDFTPTANVWHEPPKWLRITATPLWTPSNYSAESDDNRHLGVYIGGLRFWSKARGDEW